VLGGILVVGGRGGRIVGVVGGESGTGADGGSDAVVAVW
jgi:hypothetical protein